MLGVEISVKITLKYKLYFAKCHTIPRTRARSFFHVVLISYAFYKKHALTKLLTLRNIMFI